MATALKFVPPRVAMVDPRTGLISREWYLFFQGVFDRIGGSTGPSTGDNFESLFEDAGNSETNAALFSAEQGLQQLPIVEPPTVDQLDRAPRYEDYTVDVLLAEISGLRDQVAELAKEVDALKQSSAI